MDKINESARDCAANFSEYVMERLSEAMTYYRRLRKKYEEILSDDFERAEPGLPKFHSFAENESIEDKVIAVCAMIVVPFVIPYVADYRRSELKNELARFKPQMEDWLGLYIDEVRGRLGVSADVEAAFG
jgi:hypothetical protein